MIPRLLALAVLAVIVYFAITQGMPWLQTTMGSSGGSFGGANSGGSESTRCVNEAGAAADTVVDELLPHARPPVDSAVWGTALVRAASSLAAAENACSCPTEACVTATDAIYELRAMFDELDDIARGNPAGIGNPARRQERAYDLLNEARSLALSE